MVAFAAGFGAGILAQILFRAVATVLIGPVAAFLSSRTLAYIVILLAPIVLSLMFIRIEEGSVSEDFLHGFQLGSLIWLIVTLFRIYG